MDHPARTLTTLVAAAMALLALAAPAMAVELKVRAELGGGNLTQGLINRTVVDVRPDDARVPIPGAAGVTCPSDSLAAALSGAAGPGGWLGEQTTAGDVVATKIKNAVAPTTIPSPPATKAFWQAYVQGPEEDLCRKVTQDEADRYELLLYLRCGQGTTNVSRPFGCYGGIPLRLRPLGDAAFQVGPWQVGLVSEPFYVSIADGSVANGTTVKVATDEGFSTETDQIKKDGSARVRFTAPGPHTVVAYDGEHGPDAQVPDRIPVCATDGADGFCGTTRSSGGTIVLPESPCDTNGRDGLCGTVDTSGPPTFVTNIKHKQTFAARKGPGQVKGTIGVDPNAVKDVRLRLTRKVQVTSRVRIRAPRSKTGRKQKRRYRTVKRTTCSFWNADSLLIERARKCGTAGGRWWEADLDDLRANFGYSFAMTLPAGAYTLEVLSRDENGFPDLITPGRNVITFTVKSAAAKKPAERRSAKQR